MLKRPLYLSKLYFLFKLIKFSFSISSEVCRIVPRTINWLIHVLMLNFTNKVQSSTRSTFQYTRTSLLIKGTRHVLSQNYKVQMILNSIIQCTKILFDLKVMWEIVMELSLGLLEYLRPLSARFLRVITEQRVEILFQPVFELHIHVELLFNR